MAGDAEGDLQGGDLADFLAHLARGRTGVLSLEAAGGGGDELVAPGRKAPMVMVPVCRVNPRPFMRMASRRSGFTSFRDHPKSRKGVAKVCPGEARRSSGSGKCTCLGPS